jgi:phosphomannomutase
MDNLVISISGVRGIVGKALTPDIVTRFASAFGTFIRGRKVVVGRDTRVSGAMIKHSVFAGLMSAGCRIVDLDIVPTPTCSLMVEELKAKGAVVISGSHNPVEWNALKFLRSDGVYLNDEQGKELLDIYYQGNFRNVRWEKLMPVDEDRTSIERHLDKVLSVLDVDAIREAKLTVVIDSCNGAGSIITPELLMQLGCKVVRIHCTPDGLFPHNPEPIFVHLEDLRKAVRRHKADIGFAQDADADRLAIVNEKGEYLGEEYTLALAARHIVRSRKGSIVANLSTSRMLDDVADEFGVKTIRTPVGEVYVAETMMAEKSVIGGEGNGGVIDPRIHYVRDSIIGIGLILEEMAATGKKISRLARELPKYHMLKKKVECGRDTAGEIMQKLKKKYARHKLNLKDGIRIDWKDKWVHVRPSGTEFALRIIGEARTQKEARSLVNSFLEEARKIIKSRG